MLKCVCEHVCQCVGMGVCEHVPVCVAVIVCVYVCASTWECVYVSIRCECINVYGQTCGYRWV